MKKLAILTTSLLLCILGLNAQNQYNAIFYTENGEKFWIILNGVKQNSNAETNVKVTGLNAAMYKMKAIFEDKNLGQVDKTLMMPESSGEVTFRIIKNRKGKYVVRYFTVTPFPNVPPTVVGQQSVSFTTTEQPAEIPKQETTVTTTTSTTTTGSPGNVGGSININVGENSVGINVGVNDDQLYSESTVTTTTTSTTTAEPAATAQDHFVMVGYGGPIGCPWPMQEQDYTQAKQTISSKTFEDSKLKIAKQIIGSNCLFADQVRDIARLFTFENTKLEFSKYAHSRTFDQGNYFKVNDAFEFEHSIDELTEFIETGQ